MRLNILLTLLIGTILLSALACDDKGTNSNDNFSGIMNTDATGTVLGGDKDDWCYGVVYGAAKIPEPPPPTEFAFYPAYPNPCNGSVSIWFDIPVQAEVTLTVKATTTKIVKHLLTNEGLPAGTHTYNWDLTDDSDNALADGVYRVYMSAADFTCHGDIQILHPN